MLWDDASFSADASLGNQRTWLWRGWRIRYTYLRPATIAAEQNPPILLIHGFGASLQQWRDNLLELSQQHSVYAIDLLGFGGSQKAATSFGTSLWIEQVHDFWQIWIGRPMILLGHSLGALVALTTTVTYPAMVEKLVMLTLPAARQELLSGWVETVSSKMEQWFSSPLLIRLIFQIFRQPGVIRKTLGGVYQISERVDDALVEQYVRPTRDRGAARTLCYLVRSRTTPQFAPATQQLIQRLQIPTLLLWGDADRVIPLTWGRQLPPLNDHITLIEIPAAGHCLYDEYPTRINNHVLDWLREN
ncbi:MAG: alpha/beta fold hydrolase [Cyanobacteria bacterium P01_A01_bin.123]